MGLSQTSYVLGWLFTSYIKGIIVSFITIYAIYLSEIKGIE